jgi:hypothetical protein
LCKARNGYRKNKKLPDSIMIIANDFAPEANLKKAQRYCGKQQLN